VLSLREAGLPATLIQPCRDAGLVAGGRHHPQRV